MPWPFTNVRVAFPNGNEFNADVLSTDPLTDMAVLGPVSASAPQLSLYSNGDLDIGDTIFIIGYPGETDEFPQPALSQGLISKLRDWDSQNLMYLPDRRHHHRRSERLCFSIK